MQFEKALEEVDFDTQFSVYKSLSKSIRPGHLPIRDCCGSRKTFVIS